MHIHIHIYIYIYIYYMARSHVCDMTHSYLWHDSFTYAWTAAYSSMKVQNSPAATFKSVTQIIHKYVTWLILKCTTLSLVSDRRGKMKGNDSVLQCVAVCCTVLHSVAQCCTVLLFVKMKVCSSQWLFIYQNQSPIIKMMVHSSVLEQPTSPTKKGKKKGGKRKWRSVRAFGSRFMLFYSAFCEFERWSR